MDESPENANTTEGSEADEDVGYEPPDWWIEASLAEHEWAESEEGKQYEATVAAARAEASLKAEEQARVNVGDDAGPFALGLESARIFFRTYEPPRLEGVVPLRSGWEPEPRRRPARELVSRLILRVRERRAPRQRTVTVSRRAHGPPSAEPSGSDDDEPHDVARAVAA